MGVGGKNLSSWEIIFFFKGKKNVSPRIAININTRYTHSGHFGHMKKEGEYTIINEIALKYY